MPRVHKRGKGRPWAWTLRAMWAALSGPSWIDYWGGEDEALAAWRALKDTEPGCRLHSLRFCYDAPHLEADGLPSDDPELMARRLEYLRAHGITCPGRAKCCARKEAP